MRRARQLALAALVVLTTCVGVLVAPGSASAEAAPSLRDADAAYATQRYAEAAAIYADAARTSHSAAAYYNAGNAYFRAGQLGPAALAYSRALRLAPELDDARHNLDVTREAIAVRLGKDSVTGTFTTPWWANASEAVPLMPLFAVTLGADVLLVVLLLVRRGRAPGAGRVLLGLGAAVTALVFLAGGGLLLGRIVYESQSDDGVVVADEAVMRELPDVKSREMPTVHAGLVVRVVRERQGWTRVRLANQVEGWLPAEAVGRVIE